MLEQKSIKQKFHVSLRTTQKNAIDAITKGKIKVALMAGFIVFIK